MTRPKRQKRQNYSAAQRAALVLVSAYKLDRLAKPITVAAIAREVGIQPSTWLRNLLKWLTSEGYLYQYTQYRPIAISETTTETWVQKFGWRIVYRVNIIAIRDKCPDVYAVIKDRYGTQEGLL